MPVLYILIVIAVIAIWFLLSWAFPPIGKFFWSIFHEAKENMDIPDKSEEEKEKTE
jgi:hypothetical protein